MLFMLNAAATAYSIVLIVIAALVLISAGFIIFVVMKQSGNSDGTQALTGASSKDDDNESFYGQNAGSRKEAKLKLWTYICAGVLAFCSILMVILQTIWF